MSAKEYNIWIAEYNIRPWGEELQDFRIGMVTQAVRAANSKDAVHIKDCIPVYQEAKKKQTPEEMFSILQNHASGMARKDK